MKKQKRKRRMIVGYIKGERPAQLIALALANRFNLNVRRLAVHYDDTTPTYQIELAPHDDSPSPSHATQLRRLKREKIEAYFEGAKQILQNVGVADADTYAESDDARCYRRLVNDGKAD